MDDVIILFLRCQIVETAGIKFPDLKGSGVTLRSQRMKIPASVGQKKIKGVEQMLQEIHMGKERDLGRHSVYQSFDCPPLVFCGHALALATTKDLHEHISSRVLWSPRQASEAQDHPPTLSKPNAAYFSLLGPQT